MVTPARTTPGPHRRSPFAPKRLLLSFGIVGLFLSGLCLLVRQVVDWTAAHPVAAVAVLALAVPVLGVALAGMPRVRDLRRAAREGMAEVDEEAREAHAAAEHAAGQRSVAGTGENGTGEPLPPRAAARTGQPDAGAGLAHASLSRPDLDRLDLDRLDFSALDADAFEDAVARLCERDGCRAAETVGGAGDLGADVVAVAPDGRRVVIQCKRYGEGHKAGSQDVQRFGGTCFTVHGADVAAFVTTSDFTEPAVEYATACGIVCFDGTMLAAWARGAGPAPWEG